jgi:DNA polymerase III epsilon subunit-like protein/stress response protein SCP2
VTIAPVEPVLDLDHSWAVVDVETSGFQPGDSRVLSVAALALDAAGRPEKRFHTLVDAGVDPGPVHVHGLTRERLAGAPSFAEIAPELLDVLDGRVLVAHNAAFDHRFLTAEVERAGLALPVQRRLCTLALSRRLGLSVPDHKLATLATYWGVPQKRAHDALDDVEVLARILTHSLLLAARLDLPLPLVSHDGRAEAIAGHARATTPRRRPRAPVTSAPPRRTTPRARVTTAARGPLNGHRVLVIGGTHQQAADVRTTVAAQGGAAAVNLTAGVTDVILMAGGEADRRLIRIREIGLPVHTGSAALGITLPATTAETLPAATADAELAAYVGRHRRSTAGRGVPVIARGEVIDLPDATAWTVNVAWRADAVADGTEVDVVAFLTDSREQVVAEEDFVFYNAPASDHGAVSLSVDGDSEQSIRVDLSLVEEQHAKIVVAAALAGDATFGDLGAISLAVDGDLVMAASATLDAATTERTMLLAEIYRRDGSWRLRAIGQGYDDGLAELAARYGLDVAEG